MAAKKSGTRKYSKGASDKVGKAMHEMHEGTLRSGGSGEKVPAVDWQSLNDEPPKAVNQGWMIASRLDLSV